MIDAIEIRGKVNTAICYAKIGKQVAEIYQKKAIELARNRGDDMPDDLCYLHLVQWKHVLEKQLLQH